VQYYFFFRVKNVLGRSLILLAIVASGLGLLFTYTRAPWIAGAAGILTLTFLRPRYRKLTVGIGALCALAAVVGLLQAINSSFLQDRVANSLTFENRLSAMSAAFRMWRDHPLFGIGYFNWDLVYPDYHRGEYIPLYGYVSWRVGKGVEIHDIFWGRMAEEGIVGMALLGAAATLTFFRIRHLWDRVADTAFLNRDALAVFAGIFITYMVGGMAIDYRYFDLVNVIPYFLIGMLFGYRPPELPPPPPRYPLWTPPYYAQQDE
jgi:O-antigen ligase